VPSAQLHRRKPYVEITLPLAAVQPSAVMTRFDFREVEYAHPLLTLEYLNADIDDSRFGSGLPIQVEWGFPDNARTFYGYINNRRRANSYFFPQDPQEQAGFTLECIGATALALKNTGVDTFAGYTVPQVVQAVAQGAQLSSVVGDNGYVYPYLAQQGRTYWAFLVDSVKRIGYSLLARGVTISALPRNTNPLTAQNLVASFDYALNEIEQFTAAMGENTAEQEPLRWRTGWFLDPRTGLAGQMVHNGVPRAPMGTQVALPLFATTKIGFPAGSANELAQQMEGDSESNQLFLGARCRVLGNARVSAGDLVFLENIPNGSQGGVWYVREVHHVIHGHVYYMDLVLGRNAYGNTGVLGINYSLSSLPVPQLRGGLWTI